MKKSNTSRQSGFAIVLVLLLIFLIMVMTITYLRTMRTYNESRQATGVSNAVPVANQLVQDLATIIGADGNLSKNEPHDYPWTCSRMNAPYRLTYPKLFSDTGALGDPLVDDSWLSPCEPDANGKWAQVSNPVGSFIVCTTADMANIGPNFATRDRVPMDAPAGRPVTGVAVDGSGTPQSVPFQMLPVTDPRLVDTDGDGIGDALWFYPKNAWQNGIRYAAAVRVVDLSGMLNINTALGEFASAPDATTGTPRKGEGPYEINASALLGAMPNASKSFRQSAAPVVTVPSGRAPAAWTDWDFWWAAGARTKDDGTSFGSGSTRYSLTDELQLRDYANQFTSNPYPVIRGHYPALESALPAPGGDFSGATRLRVTTISGVADRYAPVPTSPFRDPNGAGFSTDGNNGGYARRPFDIFGNQNNFNQPAAPAPYPTISGTATSAFTYGGWWDIAHFWESGTYGVTDFLSGIDSGNTQAAYPYPAGFQFLTANTNADDRARQYQIQMGANSLQAALGRDNAPTVASQWMSWEPVPIMTEFYAQMPYVVCAPYAYIPASPATVKLYPNTSLASLTQAHIRNLAGMIQGNWQSATRASVYNYVQTSGSITWQYQLWDGTFTKAVKVQLTQSGSDVMVTQAYAKYIASNALGSDFDTLGGTFSAPVGQSGYGVVFGLPNQTNCTGNGWNQIYVNLVANRFATGGAGNGVGELVFGGNNQTSTDWRASCSAGVGSYALELCNPYPIPCRIANVRFNFRRQDYHTWDTFKWTATPSYASADLSAYVNAAPPAGLSRDAEGYYVLKPGERIVFYRNGTEMNGPGGARRKPFGGSPDISGLIPGGTGVYKVNLTPFSATAAAPYNVSAPDINGYPSTWNVATVELETATKWSSGGTAAGDGRYGWMAGQRLTFQSLGAGWDATNCYKAEGNVPNDRQGAPGDLVYKQIDARTFGVAEKLNLLQARLGIYPYNNGYPNQMPVDMGDEEFRTNTYAQVGSGVLPNGARLRYPDGSQRVSAIWDYGCNNTSSTMPLGSAGGGSYLDYDATNGPGSVCALGLASKVSFPTPAGVPLNAMYGGNRQDIANENWLWNYVGVPGGPFVHPVTGASEHYLGTFPELNATGNANRTIRDNSSAGSGGVERRDGFPRVLDVLKVPFAGPIYCNHWPGSWIVGNSSYRGTGTTSWWNNGPVNNPLTGTWSQNTIGDAINFYLVRDTEKLGLRGLALNTTTAWFDWPNAAAKYPVLGAAIAAAGRERLHNGDIYISQNTGPWTVPDPTPVTGNVGPGKPWSYSNGPYAKASQFWQLSWGQILCSRWQVDSPKYKGYTGNNGQTFKPGMVNLNTASKAVLKCLSLPSGVNPSTVADAIILNRENPPAGASVAGGSRKGLVLASEAFGTQGLKTYTTDSALAGGAGTSKYYTNDTSGLNLDTLSWLPQQATCRSDVFCAYIVVQGYNEKDFTLGAKEFVKMMVVFSRDCSGNPASILVSRSITRRKTTDGDNNDWYTP